MPQGTPVKFSCEQTAESWHNPDVVTVGFQGNVQAFFSDPRNIDDLNAVMAGKAIIVRLNPKAT